MKLAQHQHLAQQQTLVMTPQLQQAIKLLALSQLELIEEVGRELEANPVLADDRVEPMPRGAEDRASLPQITSEARMVDNTEPPAASTDLATRADEKKASELDWEQLLANRTLQQPSSGSRGGQDDLPSIEQTLTRPMSLEDHLRGQLVMADFTAEERTFAELVIGNLDEQGFLDLAGMTRPDGTEIPDLTIEDLAREAGLDPEDAEEVLRMIQRFDPVGVASRDLQECLRVQAELAGFDETELAVIDQHMANLEKHNYAAIARDLQIELEDVYECAREIQSFEGRPARNFSTTDERSITISPDVYVVKEADGEFHVRDNDRGLPRLYVNKALADSFLGKDPTAKEFIAEKLRNAQWLIRAIDQRRRTIIRVTQAIVERQRDFFEKGPLYLKPMILRNIAEELELHESTISRVTTNKYLHTAHGIFELKYFFNSSIKRVAGEADGDIASESVKQAIKKIVESEDKETPLSDQAIVDLLEQAEGIKIARRTVAKYREQLGILPSGKRKRLF